MSIPVVDIFAGPGGLGEGFSRLADKSGQPLFRIVQSIEKDPAARETLRLRSFYRSFGNSGHVPADYFRYLRLQVSREELFGAHPENAALSDREAWCAELGKVSERQVDSRIRETLAGRSDWILIGGPPCQAYSLVGRARNGREKNEADERHFLYREYLRILNRHRPLAFVMENVKGLLSAKVGQLRIVQRILEDLRAAGYELHTLVQSGQARAAGFEPEPAEFVLRSEHYGVPQARHRLIIVGLRSDANLSAPPILQKRDCPATVRDALAGLPHIRSRRSARSGADSPEAWTKAIRQSVDSAVIEAVADRSQELAESLASNLGRLAHSRPTGDEFIYLESQPSRVNTELWYWYYEPRLEGVCNHASRSHMDSDLGRYFFAACYANVFGRSPTLKDFPASLVPRHRNIDRRRKHQDFADRFRVQCYGASSSTVTAHISKDGHYFIHPDPRQCRSLTVREAARLQTFPDDYRFEGNRTSQYQQVGNAVPPYLAYHIAESLYATLTGKDRPDDRQPRPRTAQLEHVAHQRARHEA